MVITKDQLNVDISTREDLEIVIKEFYSRLIKESYVGKFFRNGVSEWQEHLDHVTDYWESRLFAADTYDKSVLPRPC